MEYYLHLEIINSRGEVVLHSRRAFSWISSSVEAKFIGIVWAVESIGSHQMEKVIFASEIVGAVKRPRAWPSFRAYGSEIREALRRCTDWEMSAVSIVANKGAFLIAKSVTSEQKVQSYVASGAPNWLRDMIEEERCAP
ncbi:hypothetical protein BRARA_G00194 [Brassica rapa]|uniref:RNase H type-1 domain-containing protein n=1 Tax=Brassica campestris TaxID=3711 RepID=A0A397YS10_BRACM|nr:hypothetical protein BRARA_G00194 [Brassica rapa]